MVGFGLEKMMETKQGCVFCGIVADVAAKRFSEDFVAESSRGILVLDWFQVWRGYGLFIAKTHVEELFQFRRNEAADYFSQMTKASFGISQAVGATKMNCSQLGNEVPHVHFHLTPRFGKEDPGDPSRPIWQTDRAIRKREPKPSAEEKRPTIVAIREALYQQALQGDSHFHW